MIVYFSVSIFIDFLDHIVELLVCGRLAHVYHRLAQLFHCDCAAAIFVKGIEGLLELFIVVELDFLEHSVRLSSTFLAFAVREGPC